MLEYFYAQTLLRLGKKNEATVILRRAVALSPGTPEGHYELGRADLESNRLKAARTEFEKTIQLAPQYANAYYQLAQIYAKTGETEKARRMAERVRQLRQSQDEAALKAQDSLLSLLQQSAR
jgi:tetratricopeptide (TPR) repeat protein